jgi:hypothetical protein
MKHFTLTIMFSVPALVNALAFGPALAQPSSAQAPPAPPAPGFSSPGQSSPVVEGIVAQYLMNHYGEVDGLLLNDGTQVHFPPHMERDLIAVAKPNDPVNVQGYRGAGGPVVQAYAITNTQSGQSIVEREPGLFDRPIIPPYVKDRSLVERHAEGAIRVLLYGPRGELNGAVLEDRTIVRVPPHVAYQVAGLLQVGQSISAIGYGTENEHGRVIEATAMGTSGKSMIPINDPGPGGFRQ